MITKLERVPLSKVGWHEALDFTRWLEENIEVVNEVTDLNLVSAEREKSAGTFRVDIVAEDGNANPVVIENQLTKSDHDHLGKLITYLAAFDAKAALWIVSDPRPEHVAAITWLNESPNAAFYLLKVEAVKINESEPAPLLTLIVGPSEESKQIGEGKKELAERHRIRYRFWEALLDRAKEKTLLYSGVSATKENYIWAGTGKTGLVYSYVVRQHDAQVECYIDRGKDSGDENKRIFNELANQRKEIERDFGGELVWDWVEGRQGCRIKKDILLGGYRDEANWPEIQDAMIDAMSSLEKALKPKIESLNL